jgi:hypothetical protein
MSGKADTSRMSFGISEMGAQSSVALRKSVRLRASYVTPLDGRVSTARRDVSHPAGVKVDGSMASSTV